MRQYLDVVRTIMNAGRPKGGPHAAGTICVPGVRMEFDLDDGFPLLTTRSLKASWRALCEELLWFISGSTDITVLQEKGIKFWNTWGTPDKTVDFGRPLGNLGPIYGHQWRNSGATPKADGTYEPDGFDQLGYVVDGLKRNPDNRRYMVSTWSLREFNNPDGSERVWLAPCHGVFHIIHQEGELTLVHFQRSGDVPVGIPFNIGSYALLLHLIARTTGLRAKRLVHIISDAHIFVSDDPDKDQRPAMEELLIRQPKPLPTLVFRTENTDLFSYRDADDFGLADYDPHPAIKNIPVLE